MDHDRSEITWYPLGVYPKTFSNDVDGFSTQVGFTLSWTSQLGIIIMGNVEDSCYQASLPLPCDG